MATIESAIEATKTAERAIDECPAFLLDDCEIERHKQHAMRLLMAALDDSKAAHGEGSKEHDATLDSLAASVAWLIN